MRLALLCVCVCVCAFASPAAAKGIIVVSPVYSQLVALPTPGDFKAGSEHEQKGTYILELTPKSENVEAWSQMITLTGGKDLAGKIAPIDMAAHLAEGYKTASPTSFSARSLPPPKVRGASEVFAGYLGCGTVNGQSEAMVFLVLRGATDIYTLQWAAHGPAVDKPMEPDPAIWQPRAETLGLTRICDMVAGERAPYPSCTQ